jgi:DNA-binding CsgD family transcriptional regulator
MPSLDDISVRMLLELDTDLTDQTLDGFIAQIRRHFGLAHSAYFCASFPGRSLAAPFFTGTYSRSWTDHYMAQRYVSIDPVINIGARTAHPVDWAHLPRDDDKVRRLFGEAVEAGVGRNGLTFPIRGPRHGHWALFIATSSESDAEWALRRRDLLKGLMLIANYVHQRAYDLHGQEAPVDLDAITKREIEALEWIAEGKNIEDTAMMMRISTAAVMAHLDSARHKLHAVNRVHAITKAIREGLIQ